jgi:hypothetical protein
MAIAAHTFFINTDENLLNSDVVFYHFGFKISPSVLITCREGASVRNIQEFVTRPDEKPHVHIIVCSQHDESSYDAFLRRVIYPRTFIDRDTHFVGLFLSYLSGRFGEESRAIKSYLHSFIVRLLNRVLVDQDADPVRDAGPEARENFLAWVADLGNPITYSLFSFVVLESALRKEFLARNPRNVLKILDEWALFIPSLEAPASLDARLLRLSYDMYKAACVCIEADTAEVRNLFLVWTYSPYLRNTKTSGLEFTRDAKSGMANVFDRLIVQRLERSIGVSDVMKHEFLLMLGIEEPWTRLSGYSLHRFLPLTTVPAPMVGKRSGEIIATTYPTFELRDYTPRTKLGSRVREIDRVARSGMMLDYSVLFDLSAIRPLQELDAAAFLKANWPNCPDRLCNKLKCSADLMSLNPLLVRSKFFQFIVEWESTFEQGLMIPDILAIAKTCHRNLFVLPISDFQYAPSPDAVAGYLANYISRLIIRKGRILLMPDILDYL